MSNKDVAGWILENIMKNIDTITGRWDNGQKNNKAIMQLSAYRNGATNYQYRGINVLTCFAHKTANDFNSVAYYSKKQFLQLGLRVKYDEFKNHNMIVYYMQSKFKDKKDPDKTITIPFMRYTKVWNLDQIEDSPEKEKQLEKHNTDNVEPVISPNEKIDEIEEIINNYVKREKSLDIVFQERNETPYYTPVKDYISVPKIELYDSTARYYEALVHETVHSTDHPTRLNRQVEGMRNKNTHAFEELVAEFGVAFFSEINNVEYDFTNCLRYIKSWYRHLKENPQELIKATSKGKQAVEYIMDIVTE